MGQPFTFVIRSGESVTVTSRLTNQGEQAGSYSADIRLDGIDRHSETITLQPGESRDIVYTLRDLNPGDHVLEVGDQQTVFTTTVWINWWLIGGLIRRPGGGDNSRLVLRPPPQKVLRANTF